MDRTTSSDNPNYFDEDAATDSSRQNSRSFFLFKKRNAVNRSVPSKSTCYENFGPQQIVETRRHHSFKDALRSRSNSSGSSKLRTSSLNKKDTKECTPQRAFFSSNTAENIANDDVFYTNSTEAANNEARSKKRISGEDIETRRHSISTFMTKELFRSGSVSDEVPKTLAPKAPAVSENQSEQGACSITTVDDILFVLARHNEQAMVWVNHLKTCFDKITKQRGRLPFKFMHIKVDEDQITSELALRCQSTKLQIVIVCPMLLSVPAQCLMETLNQILIPERVLGILLDITEAHSWEIHKFTFPSYHKWRTCTVSDHEQSFVSELLGMAMDILGRALRQQPLLGPTMADTLTNPEVLSTKPATTAVANSTLHQDTFMLFPRKVKIGQNKILIILVEPLRKDDWVKIKIEKSNEIIEITNVKRRNPYTIQLNIPETCMEISMMVGIRLVKNNIDLGCRPLKCESRLRELEQILKTQDSPMEFLCQSIGIAGSDRHKLDSLLLQAYQKNVPTNFHLLNSVDAAYKIVTQRDTNPEVYPTLLHFAANFGLETLCLQLMECPGGDVACNIRNISGHTPADLAERAGHYKLADSFKNFFQMHEFTTMYYYFKGISEASPDKIVIEPHSSLQHSYDLSPSSPLLPPLPLSEGYMDMNGSGSETETGHDDISNFVSNLNYSTLSTAGIIENDEIAFPLHKKSTGQEENMLNNLNIKHDCNDNNNMLNELRITETESLEYDDSNKSDTFSQECSNLLENCNFYEDYLVQPSNLPVKIPNEMAESDYVVQPSNIPVHEYTNFDYGVEDQGQKRTKLLNAIQNSGNESSHLRLSFKKKDFKHDSECGGKSLPTLIRQETDALKRTVDDELLEIISDFKNNVFTIQEVEQLVASWKSRNDVQKCFKDKQEQLQKMREEYERIQQQMKDKLKRPTPFERMKRIFFKTRNTSPVENDSCASGPSNLGDDSKSASQAQTSHRPTSSSSLHSISSGSSGRISTVSGTSIGDSGTHSDSEELKFGFRTNSSETKQLGQNSTIDNYMIPPAPRPVENYNVFPSNIPILHGMNDYKNSKLLKPIDEAKETDATVQSIKIQKHGVLYSNECNNRPSLSSFKTKHERKHDNAKCEGDTKNNNEMQDE